MEARYLAERRRLAPILQEERRLREALAHIDSHAQRAPGNDPIMRQVGADFFWETWVARTRRNLNTELAQVVAKRLTMTDQLRTAFGRNEAVSALLVAARRDRARTRARQIQDGASNI